MRKSVSHEKKYNGDDAFEHYHNDAIQNNAMYLHFCASDDFGFVVFVVSPKCDNGKRIRQVQKARKIFEVLRTQRELQSSCRHGPFVCCLLVCFRILFSMCVKEAI